MASTHSAVRPNTLLEHGSHLGDDHRLMQDYLCWSYDEARETLSVTVGDMASNHTGTTYLDADTAEYLDIDPATSFNGGLIGSVALRRALEDTNTSGTDFVRTANAIVRTTHERVGAAWQNGAERFTGYLAHAVITPEQAQFTTVGDVYTWVNGKQVAGVDHPLGPVLNRLITDFGQGPQTWKRLIAACADQIDLDEATTEALLDSLFSRHMRTDAFTRQDSYLATSQVLIPWYMNRLQNTTDHPFSYGAIDGTATPDVFVQELTIPSADISSIVMATDGSRPYNQKAGVHTLHDLVATNPTYGERTAIHLEQPAKMLAGLAIRSHA